MKTGLEDKTRGELFELRSMAIIMEKLCQEAGITARTGIGVYPLMAWLYAGKGLIELLEVEDRRRFIESLKGWE